MSEQDVSQVIVQALQRRTSINREAAALKLSLQSGLGEMGKCTEVARMFLQRGSVVHFGNVKGCINSVQMAGWMERIVELEQERHELDRQLRDLGVDLSA